jgi:hypothetical protein
MGCLRWWMGRRLGDELVAFPQPSGVPGKANLCTNLSYPFRTPGWLRLGLGKGSTFSQLAQMAFSLHERRLACFSMYYAPIKSDLISAPDPN